MASPSAPVVVVGPQFCSPRALPLTLTMKYKGRFTVTDAGGAVVLRMDDAPFFSFRRRHDVLLDAAGVPVISIQPRLVGIAWEVFRGDSSSAGDMLFTAMASSRRWPLACVDVFLGGDTNTRRRAADFKIKGNFHRTSYFYIGNSSTMIASVNRMKSCGNAAYGATVFSHVDHAFVAALVAISRHIDIAIDQVEEDRRRRVEEERRRRANQNRRS